MPADNSQWWDEKRGYGGQGYTQSDQTFDWRSPDTTQYNAYAQQQASTSGDYLSRLQRGEDSYGEAMLQKGLGDASRAMQSQAIGRGASPSNERAAIMAGGQMAGQNNAQAAALRAQEMQAARMAHMQSLSQLRQGELGWAQLDAQQQQAAANHYAQMAGNDIQQQAETRQAIATATGAAGGFLGGMLSDERLKAAVMSASPETQDEIAQRMRGAMRTAIGGADQATGGLLGRLASAETGAIGGPEIGARTQRSADRARQRFVRGSADSLRSAVGAEPKQWDAQTGFGGGAGRMYDALADKLELARFRYKPEAQDMGAPAGDRVGVMAQDMERSDLGRTAVVEGPGGTKAIDRDNALGLSLGLHGRASERIDEQESRIAQLEAALRERGGK